MTRVQSVRKINCTRFVCDHDWIWKTFPFMYNLRRTGKRVKNWSVVVVVYPLIHLQIKRRVLISLEHVFVHVISIFMVVCQWKKCHSVSQVVFGTFHCWLSFCHTFCVQIMINIIGSFTLHFKGKFLCFYKISNFRVMIIFKTKWMISFLTKWMLMHGKSFERLTRQLTIMELYVEITEQLWFWALQFEI